MNDITLTPGWVHFITTNCGPVNSQIELTQVVDSISFHLGTNQGIFLIHIDEWSINGNIFSTSQEAVNYINNI